MREPQNRISEKGLKVWRLYGLIQLAIVIVVLGAVSVGTYLFDFPRWIWVVCAVIPVVYTYLFVYLFPKIRWLRWRYEVREQEIEIQHGLFIVKRTLVPMVRVQHVDTEQGPILRKYNLSSITISTAATIHTIPALITEEADELRSKISQLARVAEEDV